MLDTFRAKKKLLLLTYLPENSQVQAVQQQIVTLEKQKKQIETDNPGLLAVAVAIQLWMVWARCGSASSSRCGMPSSAARTAAESPAGPEPMIAMRTLVVPMS